jgi:hypothetical protein
MARDLVRDDGQISGRDRRRADAIVIHTTGDRGQPFGHRIADNEESMAKADGAKW